MKGMYDDMAKFSNWQDNLSKGEKRLIEIRSKLLKITEEDAFKRRQLDDIDKICSDILEITNGTRFRFDLDR